MLSARTRSRLSRVVVAGGGVAALEAVLALKSLAGERVRITLLAPDRTFAYRPLAATEPFGGPEVLRFPLAAIAADLGVELVRDAVAAVDGDRGVVRTQGGASVAYDALLLGVGARVREAIAGAFTFRGPQDVDRMRDLAAEAAEGAIDSVAFAAPPGATWTLPLYELALGTSVVAERAGAAPVISVVTPERRPLEAFGPEAAAHVSSLLAERGIALHTERFPDAVSGGRLWMPLAGSLAADRVVALPRLLGLRLAGVPVDGLGFIPVDAMGRVRGLEAVYAAGDGTSGPLKQGGLAAQQARAAATAIAAAAGAAVRPEPCEPVLRGVLATGDGVRYLRMPPAPGEPAVTAEAPWWPPSKIAARHLGPYLATHLALAERPAPVYAAAA